MTTAPPAAARPPVPLTGSRPRPGHRRTWWELPAALGTTLPTTDGMAAVAGAGAGAAAPKRLMMPSLATLLTGHVLRDGEVVLLILKPSLWYVLFGVLRWAAVAALVLLGANLWEPTRHAFRSYLEAGMFLLGGRVMWVLLQWMGRLYVLTDCRVLRLAGVFTVDVFDCPLRKVAHTRVTYSARERLWRLGSIEILPADDARPPGVWQTVRHPVEIREQIEAAVREAKSGGYGASVCAKV